MRTLDCRVKKYTYYIIILSLIAENEDLEKEQQIQLEHAMKDNSYLFLNILYNLKEKFESFLLYDNKEKDFKAVLSDDDKKKLEEKAKSLLDCIENYTNGRGVCIHSVVKFEYTSSTKILSLCELNFNLGDDVNIDVSNVTGLPFDNETLIKILREIVKFRKYIVELAYNFDFSKIEDNIKRSSGRFVIGF